MPEQPVSKPTPPVSRHLLATWTKGSALEQAEEATRSRQCTHQVYFGGLRIRCTLKPQTGGELVMLNAIIDAVLPNPMLPDPNTVIVFDEIVISNGAIVFPAIVFPIDKPAENK